MSPGHVLDSARHYVAGDARVAIVGAALAIGLAIWFLDVLWSTVEGRAPVDERQRAELALAAPYFEMHGFRAGDLRGLRPLGRLRVRWFLRKDWGIHDHATALERLRQLISSGHRSDPRFRDPDQPAGDLEIVDRSLLAWDAMRVVFLARCCYAVGYIDESTVWSAIDEARKLARGKFRTWAEWGRSFVAGRVIWARGGGDEYQPVVEKLLRDPGSPWNRYSWETSIQG